MASDQRNAELLYDLLFELHHGKLEQARASFEVLCDHLDKGGNLQAARWTLPAAGFRPGVVT